MEHKEYKQLVALLDKFQKEEETRWSHAIIDKGNLYLDIAKPLHLAFQHACKTIRDRASVRIASRHLTTK